MSSPTNGGDSGPRGVVLDDGESQGQIELVARPLAQRLDLHALAAAADPDQLRVVVVVEILIEAGERAAGHERVDRAGPSHQRIAAGRAVTNQRAAEQRGGGFQHRPSPRRLQELGFGVAAPLPRLLGADAALELLAPPHVLGAFDVEFLLDALAILVLAREFGDARGGGVRVEVLHLRDEPRLVHAVGDIEQVAALLEQRLRKLRPFPLARDQDNRIGLRRKRRGPLGESRVGARLALARFGERAPRSLDRSSGLDPLRLGLSRRRQPLVQPARRGVGRKIGRIGRAARGERPRLGLESLHVSPHAGDPASAVAEIFAVAQRLVPDVEGRLGRLDRAGADDARLSKRGVGPVAPRAARADASASSRSASRTSLRASA